jgi:hypothetical protein
MELAFWSGQADAEGDLSLVGGFHGLLLRLYWILGSGYIIRIHFVHDGVQDRFCKGVYFHVVIKAELRISVKDYHGKKWSDGVLG